MSLVACRTSSIDVLGAAGRVASDIVSFGSAMREAESAIWLVFLKPDGPLSAPDTSVPLRHDNEAFGV